MWAGHQCVGFLCFVFGMFPEMSIGSTRLIDLIHSRRSNQWSADRSYKGRLYVCYSLEWCVISPKEGCHLWESPRLALSTKGRVDATLHEIYTVNSFSNSLPCYNLYNMPQHKMSYGLLLGLYQRLSPLLADQVLF
jgi:hypothetical protein